MPCIVVGVETNEIAVKNPEEDLVSDWKDSVDLGGWKWCVEKEANLDIGCPITNLLAEHLRQ